MSDIPIGFRFVPTDYELTFHYLLNKVKRRRLPYETKVIECDLYGEREPSEIFGDSKEDVLYFFTKLKKKTANGSRIDRTVGTGTWKGQDSGKPVLNDQKVRIGLKKSFVYQKNNNNGGWIMHEYQLDNHLLQPEQDNDYVLCRIRKKEGSQTNEADRHQQEQNDMITEEADLIPELQWNNDHDWFNTYY